MPTTVTTAAPHSLTLPWVEQVTRGFVYCDDMRAAVSLAIAAGVHLIFSGPGGHAKSEFLEAVFGAISDQETYVKSLSQGTTTEELFGGLDFDALSRAEGAVLQFNPELSFLAYPLAIFEEGLDAPPRVLAALKDTLTAGALRNGRQHFPMSTRVIAIATNRSPQEIAEGGPEIEALVQRFPLQLEVKWPHYGKAEFTQLFATVLSRETVECATTWADIEALQQRAKSVAVGPGVRSMMAQILVELTKDHVSISPRTAIVALQLARAAAAINGRDTVVPADIHAVAFLPGALHLRQRISELIEDLAASVEAEEALVRAEQELTSLVAQIRGVVDIEVLRGISREAERLARSLSLLRVAPDQVSQRTALHDLATSLAHEATDVESRNELDRLEAVLAELRGRVSRDGSIDERLALCQDIRALISSAMNLTARGPHARTHMNRLIDEAQALLRLAEQELREARSKAGIDENEQRLTEVDHRISEIHRLLSRSITAQHRRELLTEITELEVELAAMPIHDNLKPRHDAVKSRLMVAQFKAGARHS